LCLSKANCKNKNKSEKQIPPLRCGMTNKNKQQKKQTTAKANTEILATPE